MHRRHDLPRWHLRLPKRRNQLQRHLQEPPYRLPELQQMRKRMPAGSHLPKRDMCVSTPNDGLLWSVQVTNSDPQIAADAIRCARLANPAAPVRART